MKESKFTANVLEFWGMTLLVSIISILTLGIGVPWAIVMYEKWKCNHTIIDGKRLYFDGTGSQLFGNYIKWFLLTVITIGIYGFWLKLKMHQWIVKHTRIEE